jgi:hypothetical protein
MEYLAGYCAQGDTVEISIHEWHSSVLWTGNTAGSYSHRRSGVELLYIHGRNRRVLFVGRCHRGIYVTRKGHRRDLHSLRTQHGDIHKEKRPVIHDGLLKKKRKFSSYSI